MTDDELIAIKRALSADRIHRFGSMPEAWADWLGQMDECAAELKLPNVYRTHGRLPYPKRRRPEDPRNRFPDE